MSEHEKICMNRHEADLSEHDVGPESTTRRAVLATVVVGGVGAVAGCLGDEGERPDPVSLNDGQECDTCNMRIEMHPGPVGEAFYMDDAPAMLPEDRPDGVAWFCSSTCLYSYVLENEERGHEPRVAYGTDYSRVEYRLTEEGGATVISAHLEAEAFADVVDLVFVVNSDVEGAMGSSMIGFADEGDAEAFADGHGGELLGDDDITREVLSGLGM